VVGQHILSTFCNRAVFAGESGGPREMSDPLMKSRNSYWNVDYYDRNSSHNRYYFRPTAKIPDLL